MTSQDKLAPPPGSKNKRKRVGRGDGSGHGTYSGRGLKGQKARTGVDLNPYFEGGQLPLVKRLPHKRGFTNIFKVEYTPVNIESLKVFKSKTTVSPVDLRRAGLIKSLTKPVKVLGEGEIDRALTVRAAKFSKAAKEKIEAAGGKAETI
jgi:large subunit ribosomal protein L15